MKKIILLIALSSTALSSTFATGGTGNTEGKNKKRFAPNNPVSTMSSSYTTAVGVRAIGTSGITIKHFNRTNQAIEGIIGFWPNAFSATVLVEKYANAFSEPGLNWYYGIGGHIAAKSNWDNGNEYLYDRPDDNLGLGVDGIFGIEYKIREIPIALSMDFKPFVEVTTAGNAFIALDPGLGIKVAL